VQKHLLRDIRNSALEIRHKPGRGDLTIENQKQFTAAEVKVLLQWKLGRTTGRKQELIERYIATPRPPKEDAFTSADGRRLQLLKAGLIPLRETALGVAAKQNASAVLSHIDQLDDSDEDRLFQALYKKRKGKPKDDRDYEDGHDEPPQAL
jgi:hypothetical protein